jgi:SEC-C motif-containing protein
MKTGRNQPCPCGSGKKYKVCCLKKDQEAALASAMAAPLPDIFTAPRPLPPIPAAPAARSAEPVWEADPRLEALDARWSEFEAAEYEERIALFRRTLDEPELMDGEMAFSMLDLLFNDAGRRNERRRFNSLVAELRDRLPEVYSHERAYLMDWVVLNAAAEGAWDSIPDLPHEVARCADDHADVFEWIVSTLAYHGQLAVIAEALPAAWPGLQDPAGPLPWDADREGTRTAAMLLLRRLESGETPDPDDPALLEEMRRYVDLDAGWLAAYLGHLTGRDCREWSLDAFSFLAHRGRADPYSGRAGGSSGKRRHRQAWEALILLSAEFTGYLHRERNVSWSKAELGREQLVLYHAERLARRLKRRIGLDELEQRRRLGLPEPGPPMIEHVLCPDRETLDRFLDDWCSVFNPQFHKVAVLLELIPAWLAFLEARGLLDAARRAQTESELRPLVPEYERFLGESAQDPTLARNLAHWGEEQTSRDLPAPERENE